MSFIAELLGIGAGAGLTKSAYERLGETGEKAFGLLSGGYIDPETGQSGAGLSETLRDMLAFEPYTITTATGGKFGMTGGADGGPAGFTLSMSPDEKRLSEALMSGAEELYTQAETTDADREAAVLQRLQDLRAPERERERLDLEQRLAAQGRLGTRTAMFGGTPEQLALAQAQEEQQAKDILAAMEYAEAQQDRQRKAAAGLLEAAYLPQGQLIAALEPGMTVAERQREALSEQAQTYGETYASAVDALLSSALGQADLLGSLGSGLVTGASKGLFDIF